MHRHCACTLVFCDEDAVDRWCAEYAVERGEIVNLEKVAELARVWYGGHLAPDWRKATASEARARFESVGLLQRNGELIMRKLSLSLLLVAASVAISSPDSSR